jgi:hypothetical protein
MEDGHNKRDLGYYSMEIVKDHAGVPLIIVKFKSEHKNWAKEFSWYPTLAQLEFLYKTTKWMGKNSPKNQVSKIPPASFSR